LDHGHHPSGLDPHRSSPDLYRGSVMRILALIIAGLLLAHVWKGWPEVSAYMSADAITQADYLIAKTNRQKFEFPERP
jgi:hypothetical protein